MNSPEPIRARPLLVSHLANVVRPALRVMRRALHRHHLAGVLKDQVIVETFQLGDDIAAELDRLQLFKIHYGCGNILLGDHWLNVDLPQVSFCASELRPYLSVNLVQPQPFANDTFAFAFCEDFIEHLTQADSIIFLTESFRVLKPGGVLRVSFPGLRGVLRKHYNENSFACASAGKIDAYTKWGHEHFYCEESLELVARNIGYKKIEFVEFGQSHYPELTGLDSRPHQINLNLLAELTK